MSVNLTVSAAPHIRSNGSTRNVMLGRAHCACPGNHRGVVLFGLRALTLVLVSAAACVVFEALFCLVTRHSLTVGDLSAVVTGVLLALCVPDGCPYWRSSSATPSPSSWSRASSEASARTSSTPPSAAGPS